MTLEHKAAQSTRKKARLSAKALSLVLILPAFPVFAIADTTHVYDSLLPYRTDHVRIPLKSGDEAGHQTEWKVIATAGQPLIYSWSVSGVTDPEEFYADFHGHTVPPDEETEEFEISYRKTIGLYASGGLTTTIDGEHGWFFKNDSAKAVVVHLQVSGFYELAPGNDAPEDTNS